MHSTNSATFTINNPTKEQLAVILKAMKASKMGAPENTVSEEEDENFGKKPLTKKQLKAKAAQEEEAEEESEEESEEAEEESDAEEEEESEEEAEDEEEASLSFEEVKATIGRLGAKHPTKAEAILKSFNLANLKELKAAPKKWEPVYKKVKARLAALKKAK
jgi:hypothetical protein